MPTTTRGRQPQTPEAYQLSLPSGPVSARLLSTGGAGAQLAADFNNSTPVITEIYMAELLAPLPFITSGVAPFNGSDVTDSTKLGLYDASGTLILATADTQSSGADAYQRIPWAWDFSSGTKTAFAGPKILPAGTYYVGQILDGTTSRYQTFAVGNFGAGKLTGHVYATAMDTTGLTVTPPITFTTALGPVATLY